MNNKYYYTCAYNKTIVRILYIIAPKFHLFTLYIIVIAMEMCLIFLLTHTNFVVIYNLGSISI